MSARKSYTKMVRDSVKAIDQIQAFANKFGFINPSLDELRECLSIAENISLEELYNLINNNVDDHKLFDSTASGESDVNVERERKQFIPKKDKGSWSREVREIAGLLKLTGMSSPRASEILVGVSPRTIWSWWNGKYGGLPPTNLKRIVNIDLNQLESKEMRNLFFAIEEQLGNDEIKYIAQFFETGRQLVKVRKGIGIIKKELHSYFKKLDTYDYVHDTVSTREQQRQKNNRIEEMEAKDG